MRLILYRPVFEDNDGCWYIPIQAEWRSADCFKYKTNEKVVGWIKKEFTFRRKSGHLTSKKEAQ